MFTFSRRFRRRVAVLSVLSLLASVLVVAAPAAAADPKADYTATFSACVGDAAASADFTDAAGNANEGDINCIAYYGITMGTSASTYAPLMSVTREQMALFLTRLAAKVEIEMVDDSADTGFTDIGELSDESQTAIAQLKKLGITKGNNASGTTYGPDDHVTRGQMALFIARLMDEMTPLADGEIGLSSTTQYGYTPSDVDNNDMDADIGSPYTDLGQSTKEEWDAITHLYELGVTVGISETGYHPSALIRRDHMARFMAGVLDHSNARPAGLTLAASDMVVWGEASPTLLASVRDDGFMPVEDRSVDMFSSTAGDDALRDDGTCNLGDDPDDVNFGDFVTGDCVWNDNDDATDVSGNLFVPQEVSEGTTRLFYGWIGQEDGDEFDMDDVASGDMGSVSVTAKHDQADIKIMSPINARADDGYDLDSDTDGDQNEGQKVDLQATQTLKFIAQLVDANGSAVARSGVEIRVKYEQGPTGKRSYINTHELTDVTDENGQVEYVVTGPSDDPKDDEQTRADDITFISEGLNEPEYVEDVYWVEEDPVLTSDSLVTKDYLLASDSGSVNATVHLWDQYGNAHRSHREQRVEITIDADSVNSEDGEVLSEVRGVISRGYARWTRTKADLDAGEPVAVTYDVRYLARNSNGTAVQYSTGAAGFAGLTVAEIDALPITYNDGEVITASDSDTTPVHESNYDHDGDSDPDDLLSGPLQRPTGDQVRRNIINSAAQDLYDTRASALDNDTNGTQFVQVVRTANSQDTDEAVVHAILGDRDQFLTDTIPAGETDGDGDADLVYSYDDDDIYIDSTPEAEGVEISMDRFESMLGRDLDAGRDSPVSAEVEVIAYDVDGTSIFRVTTKAS